MCNKKFFLFVFLLLMSFSVPVFASTSNGTIDSEKKYAWGENMGWVNFAPANGDAYSGLNISNTAISGDAWSSVYGWINFSPLVGSGVKNTSAGVVSGYAWSSSLGWINMSGLKIDSNGKFKGTVGTSGSTAGRITFDCANCNVLTDWRPTLVVIPNTDSGGSNSGGNSGGNSGSSNRGGSSGGGSPGQSAPNPATPALSTPSVAVVKQPLKLDAYTPQSCEPYLTSYIEFGKNNNSSDVRKLEVFLNLYEKETLNVDGVYKKGDVDAVKRFQQKHKDVLQFWGLSKPTGYVYVATQKAINRVYCERMHGFSCPYFKGYSQEGDVSSEILKVKIFLNNTQGEKLDLSSVSFDRSLTGAIKRFQKKYKDDVLTPWGLKTPSGRWYQATVKKAEDVLGCFAPVRLDNGTVLE